VRESTTLFELLPALAQRVAWLPLGELPTPLTEASAVLRARGQAGELWLKRDDQSSPVYGGSKLRLLEHLLAAAKQQGATEVYSTGAIGSNFATATALHAPRAGLTPGAICFPQALTPEAERSHALLSARARVVSIAHWSLLPLEIERVQLRARLAGGRAVVLSQVRFGAEALFGYVNAGLELARQVEQGACPAPARIVLPVGSGASTAGLVAGLSLARRLGLWRAAAPCVEAVRIAAWPLSRRGRVLGLAEKALRGLARLSGDASLALGREQLVPLRLITDQLGSGYPHATPAGQSARRAFAEAGYAILDDTYTAKAAAHVLRSGSGPVLLWCTKSSAAL
jgi:1-aminocyclopropane-1-carboxylate deaminase/D-cysteine desulfhydrase-like pyridoxal-dependent ACC family enzyme